MSTNPKYTNNLKVPISLAVWLAHDTYDHNDDPNHISVTGLIKPIKQTILAMRVPQAQTVPDVAAQVANRIGSAVHDAIETAWTYNHEMLMKHLGYPGGLVRRILINPNPADVTEDDLPVYMEKRLTKSVGTFNISGKFDFVIEGGVRDFKVTKTYAWENKGSDLKYQLQGSIYRWLGPDIITQDHMYIDFIFVDWMAMKAKINPRYPQAQTIEHRIPLLSLTETERYVVDKLAQLTKLIDADESAMPMCTPEDLWMDKPVYKYYKDAKKAGVKGSRSTKNFDDPISASNRLAKDGHTGKVVKVEGSVKACRYCAAITVCKQKDIYINNGTLKL